jgi:hypothetical protein
MTLVLEATLKGRDYFLDFDEMELLSKKAAEVCSLTIKEINEKVWHPKMQPLVESSLQREEKYREIFAKDVSEFLEIIKRVEGKVDLEEIQFITNKLAEIKEMQIEGNSIFREILAYLSKHGYAKPRDTPPS